MKKLLLSTLLPLVGFTGMAQAPSALAYDYSQMPAYACRANNYQSQADLSYGTSRVFNNNYTKNRFLICASYRDTYLNDTGTADGGFLYAKAQVYPGRTVTCTAYINNSYGSVLDSYSTSATASASPFTYKEINVFMYPNEQNTSSTNFHSIVCTIPPRSGIRFTAVSQDD